MLSLKLTSINAEMNFLELAISIAERLPNPPSIPSTVLGTAYKEQNSL